MSKTADGCSETIFFLLQRNILSLRNENGRPFTRFTRYTRDALIEILSFFIVFYAVWVSGCNVHAGPLSDPKQYASTHFQWKKNADGLTFRHSIDKSDKLYGLLFVTLCCEKSLLFTIHET